MADTILVGSKLLGRKPVLGRRNWEVVVVKRSGVSMIHNKICTNGKVAGHHEHARSEI